MYKCRLKAILAEREIEQKVFAEQVGMSQTTLSLLVRNRTKPSFEKAMKIAELLEMKVEDIWVKEE
ncbi:helix-turn-helix transcriptional regulator [Ectobacillus antri]|uniref:helix-turn-helix transcriptional regulator n=1 Tax=Ectobacillus antri TaxID=2486280 RepID=UPI000F5A11D0|nr:helix-turn-helix transcriptional regulator [Ectobacillus antri]